MAGYCEQEAPRDLPNKDDPLLVARPHRHWELRLRFQLDPIVFGVNPQNDHFT